MITNQSKIIQRHKNPIGVFLRILIYPLIAYGLWSKNFNIILVGVVIEILNWTIMPPVEQTFPFIQNVIDIELNWLNAENNWLKKISLFLFVLFAFLLMIGLWIHSISFIVSGFVSLIIFNLLMNKIGRKY